MSLFSGLAGDISFNSNTGQSISLVYFIIVAVAFAVSILGWVMILRKAGYSGWWVMINFIPAVGTLIFFLYLAFVPWPGQSQGFTPRSYTDRTQRSADYSTFSSPSSPQPTYGQAAVHYEAAANTPLPTLGQPLPLAGSAGASLPAFGQPMSAPQPAATYPIGWYAAQDYPGYERYWDGSAWSDQYRPAQGTTT